MLEDGTYDAVVIDADIAADSDSDSGDDTGDGTDGGAGGRPATVRVELAVAAGGHKGEVVAISTTDPALTGRDPLDLLGLPATITVAQGRPSFCIDD